MVPSVLALYPTKDAAQDLESQSASHLARLPALALADVVKQTNETRSIKH